ncbi:MAG TPA: DUF4232 domain-containing protein [Mycobacteriales bacterium]|nr:DUF4232 domain-containing protein [Mycobacteriales bacterium]
MTKTARFVRLATTRSVLAGTALLVAACGPSPHQVAGAASAGPTTPASTGAPTPTATSSTAGPTGPAPCPTRSLQAKVGVSQGTAGSTYTVIDFTNLSNSTCTLYGYPGVSFAGGTPVTQIGVAAGESPTTPRTLVTLAAGATANALLRITDAGNYPAAECRLVTAQYLQIYPPNQTTPIYLGYTSQTCAKPVRILTVSVIQAGAGSAS